MYPNIRNTYASDYEAISRILHEAKLVDDWFTQTLFLSLLDRNRGHYFVATTGATVVGTIFSSHDGGYFGYIYKLAVIVPHQRLGVGSALLHSVVRKFQNMGIDWYFGHVDKDNEASIRLLAKYGIVPQHRFLMADNWDASAGKPHTGQRQALSETH